VRREASHLHSQSNLCDSPTEGGDWLPPMDNNGLGLQRFSWEAQSDNHELSAYSHSHSHSPNQKPLPDIPHNDDERSNYSHDRTVSSVTLPTTTLLPNKTDSLPDSTADGASNLKKSGYGARRRSTKASANILRNWWLELLAALLVLVALIAITATLTTHQGRPLPQWPCTCCPSPCRKKSMSLETYSGSPLLPQTALKAHRSTLKKRY